MSDTKPKDKPETVEEIAADVIRVHLAEVKPEDEGKDDKPKDGDSDESRDLGGGVRVTQAIMEEVQRAREGAYETLDDLSAGAREVLLRNDTWRREAAHAAHPGNGERARDDRQRYFNLSRSQAE
jgi:hypothetical protein